LASASCRAAARSTGFNEFLQEASQRNGLLDFLARWLAFIDVSASIARLVRILKTSITSLEKAP
jgi:hypothetical protein